MENEKKFDLNEMYEDFSYRNEIFNDTHIDFIDRHGNLPEKIESAEDRELVSEYCRTQLEQGNITDSQRSMLEALGNALNASDEKTADDKQPGFIETVRKMSEWADKVQEKAEQKREKEESRNNTER